MMASASTPKKELAMFTLFCEVNDDGIPIFDDSREPEKYPPLEYPKYPEIDKGWYAQECAGETQQNQLSFNFLKAIREKRWKSVNQCLKHRIDLDLYGEDDKTALHLAIEHRHEGLVRFLLQQAADLEVSDGEGQTPLHLACFNNDLRLVRCILFCGGNAHRLTSQGANVLHFCAMNGNIRMAKKFIKIGVDLTCKTKNGSMPLDVAKAFLRTEMAEFLQSEMDKQTQSLKDVMTQLQAEEDAKALSWAKRRPAWDGNASNPSRWRGDEIVCSGTGTFGNDSDGKMFWDMFDYENPDSAKKRVRFVDDDGHNEWSDEETILTECVNCGSLEESEQDHCSQCGYILHEVCPECYAIVDSPNVEDHCQRCFATLWAEKNTASIQNFSNSGLMITCSVCQSDASVSNKYCNGCGYVLLDLCPHCSSIRVKGEPGNPNTRCTFCHGVLWDSAAGHAISAISYPEPTNTVLLTTECAICTFEQSVQNDYCEECYYALSDICPNCLHMPTSLAPTCPKCNESLWNIPSESINLRDSSSSSGSSGSEIGPLW